MGIYIPVAVAVAVPILSSSWPNTNQLVQLVYLGTQKISYT